MQLIVAAVGTRMPGWIDQGWREYARRFPKAMPLKLREIPALKRSPRANLDAIAKREGAALLAAAPKGAMRVAMDERGAQWSTAELVTQLAQWMQNGNDICFLVGGPEGLDNACLEIAQIRWSLGKLTLPHSLVRVLLAEALYRAWTVTCNHPYHRQ